MCEHSKILLSIKYHQNMLSRLVDEYHQAMSQKLSEVSAVAHDRYMTKTEAAHYSGYSLSSISRFKAQGKLRFHGPKVLKSHVDRLLVSHNPNRNRTLNTSA